MQNLKVLRLAARCLFVLCLPLLLLTTSIGWAVNSPWLYQYGFHKYDVGQTTGLPEAELEKVAHGLISYFNSGEEYIALTVIKDGKPFSLFNQRETTHLKDVKGLIRLDYYVLLGTLVYTLGYALYSLFRRKREHRLRLASGMVWGSGIILSLMLVIGLGTLLNFDQLFLQFHLLSFSNELWQLDPSRDYLIMLFPQGFWYDVTLFCAGLTAGLAIVLGGVAWVYLRRTKSPTFVTEIV